MTKLARPFPTRRARLRSVRRTYRWKEDDAGRWVFRPALRLRNRNLFFSITERRLITQTIHRLHHSTSSLKHPSSPSFNFHTKARHKMAFHVSATALQLHTSSMSIPTTRPLLLILGTRRSRRRVENAQADAALVEMRNLELAAP
ncbi:hypothetical protein EJ06DRAFT_266392 [Trichodelitschia bisporula]|uniref:Uncharacterized protein n=1 Tax=Trichodelitschia bisporula TaxID=703511 RepID=A0A6G1HIH0_9PEZI|nr:hypothetical protein EJ06DRAFT_266392 [Trichodelitschia bisporula]